MGKSDFAGKIQLPAGLLAFEVMKLEKSLLSSWLRLYSICAPCGSETRILASGGPDCRILILTSEDWNAREFFTSLECKK